MKQLIFCICLLFFNAVAFAATDNAPAKVKWGYAGKIAPDKWHTLSPDYALCGKGKQQSPINIEAHTAQCEEFSTHYQAAPMVLARDVDTTLVIDKERTVVNTGHSIQLNFPHQQNEYITLNKKMYYLVQFHFHSPAEHEVAGHTYPLEIHFVHQSSDGEAAAIAVFVKPGKENAALQDIIDHFPLRVGQVENVKHERVNPAQLLPKQRDFYSYMGSLTSPPCGEDLHWIVMMESIMASPSQIIALRQAAGGANARPLQPLNGRTVQQCDIKEED